MTTKNKMQQTFHRLVPSVEFQLRNMINCVNLILGSEDPGEKRLEWFGVCVYELLGLLGMIIIYN